MIPDTPKEAAEKLVDWGDEEDEFTGDCTSLKVFGVDVPIPAPHECTTTVWRLRNEIRAAVARWIEDQERNGRR